MGEDPTQSVLEALPEDSQDHCFRVILQGPCDGLDTTAIEEALEGRYFSMTLEDKTYTRGPRWEGIEEDTLRGEIMRELKFRYDNAPEEQKDRLLAAADLLKDLMDGREVSL